MFPQPRYQIIYADPPWRYSKFRHWRVMGKGIAAYYETLTTSEIAALPVSKIAAGDCILFLWTTFPRLPDALAVIAAWGFTYKTVGFTWLKLNARNGKPFFGMGHYTRSNCEVCLIGVKGRSLRVSNRVSSVVFAPRQEHSRKPDEVRERIVTLCGNRPRIELFARERVSGWDAWGDEVKSDIELAPPSEAS
ncbi:MAG: MT-A70 family methyltransferase [Candidatus Pacebacteria bacterium]|nr:MT-A70 family methyltransferase [Candidatus Paceibacterota bacterium]